MGIVSYGFTAVAARDLPTQSVVRLLVIWTLLNILLLVFQFPIESYALSWTPFVGPPATWLTHCFRSAI